MRTRPRWFTLAQVEAGEADSQDDCKLDGVAGLARKDPPRRPGRLGNLVHVVELGVARPSRS